MVSVGGKDIIEVTVMARAHTTWCAGMLGFSCLMGAWRASGWAGGLLTDLGVNEIFFWRGSCGR